MVERLLIIIIAIINIITTTIIIMIIIAIVIWYGMVWDICTRTHAQVVSNRSTDIIQRVAVDSRTGYIIDFTYWVAVIRQ